MRTTIEFLEQVYKDVVIDYNESADTLEVLELIDELQTKLEKLI